MDRHILYEHVRGGFFMSINLGELISLIFMSLALGMDAFSVSLGLGLREIRLKRIAIIGFNIGVLHVIFPFLGIIVGQYLSKSVGDLTTLAGGILLVFIGTHMFLSAFNYELRSLAQPYGFPLFILMVTVSIDSFPVGLGLGLSGMENAFALLLFGSTTMILSWVGMLVGRKVQGFLGAYSEILGGSILIVIGLLIIFG